MSEIVPAAKPDQISKADQAATPAGIVPRSVDEAVTVAKAFAASGLFPDIKNAAQAVAKIMAGAEYGIAPASAMNSFHVVQGKIGMHYSLVGALIKRSGKYNFYVHEKTDKVCRIEFFENGASQGFETFTVEDAKRQSTQNMQKFPATMLYARCLTNGARTYCSEIFMGGVYTPDELEGLDAPTPTAPATKVDELKARLSEPAPASEAVPADDYDGPTVKADEDGVLL